MCRVWFHRRTVSWFQSEPVLRVTSVDLERLSAGCLFPTPGRCHGDVCLKQQVRGGSGAGPRSAAADGGDGLRSDSEPPDQKEFRPTNCFQISSLRPQQGEQDSCVMASWQLCVPRVQTCSGRAETSFHPADMWRLFGPFSSSEK